jgi:DNA-binding NarL/FixJ family response regulator
MNALLETVTSHHRELEMFEAASGQEALPLIETILPDVILMDAQMPLMNGIQATRIIKERWPTIKVVMLTMYAAYQSDAFAAGVDVFLLKGCPEEELFAAIFS